MTPRANHSPDRPLDRLRRAARVQPVRRRGLLAPELVNSAGIGARHRAQRLNLPGRQGCARHLRPALDREKRHRANAHALRFGRADRQQVAGHLLIAPVQRGKINIAARVFNNRPAYLAVLSVRRREPGMLTRPKDQPGFAASKKCERSPTKASTCSRTHLRSR